MSEDTWGPTVVVSSRSRTRYVVAVYMVDQAYGGPEEGGWWYQVGTLERVLRVFKSEDAAFAFCRRFNDHLHHLVNAHRPSQYHTNSEGVYAAEVHEDVAPAGYPDCRPHYE